MLLGLTFDDMDEGILSSDSEISLTHGNTPKVEGFKSMDEEISFVRNKIDELIKCGVSQEEICVVARTNEIIDKYKSTLSKDHYQIYEIKKDKPDDRSIRGIRCATMHRVKGLEFQYVFVVSMNKGIIPISSKNMDENAIDAINKREKCLAYVALSRARKETFISYYGKVSDLL